MSLRSMIIRMTGLNPNETDQMLVFFRQNLAGLSFREIYEELSRLSKERDRVVQSIDILVAPTVGIKETQWYSIIRYCLYCWGQTNIASVVFAPPTSSGMNLYLLHDVPFLLSRFDKEMQWCIHQMMALRIAVWLTKPTYFNLQADNQPIETLAQYLHYVRRALFEALDVHQACSGDHLRKILYEHYKLDLQSMNGYSRTRKVVVRLDQSSFTWTDVSDMILNQASISMWLRFNLSLKKDPIADRIRQGVAYNTAVTASI